MKNSPVKNGIVTRPSRFFRRWEHYKAEIIASIPDDQPISLYRQGKFIDLCRGPHLPSPRHLGTAFKLTKLAGAYWRGDSNNVMLQRIYGTAWANEEQLAADLHRLEEAEKRDHRKLGRELEICSLTDAVGRGLPIWLPAGVVLRDELQWLSMQEERRDGYVPARHPRAGEGAVVRINPATCPITKTICMRRLKLRRSGTGCAP
jgi:threonyl-tRNA synthetase